MTGTRGQMRLAAAAMVALGMAFALLAGAAAAPGQAQARASQGWHVKSGKLCYVLDTGKKAKDTTIDGIKLLKNGYAKQNTASKLKLACISRIKKITKPGWKRSRKLKACFSYALTRPFVNSNEPKDIGTAGWVQRCALRALRTERTECFGCACSFAMLAYELGYKPTVYGYPLDHAYVIIDGKRWDNMASQPKIIGVKHWKVLSWSTLDPQGTKTSVFRNGQKYEPYKGLVKLKGSYYFYRDGKRLKKTWKKVSGKTYYFRASGRAATGPCKARRTKGAKSAWWVFSSKGVLQRGAGTRVVKVAGKRYRVTKSGRAKAGWAEGNTKRYLADGELATGTRFVGRKLCRFGGDGTYDADRSRALRRALRADGPATGLIRLLGKARKTTTDAASCWPQKEVLGLEGVDRTRVYAHLKLSTFVASDGTEYLESLVSR